MVYTTSESKSDDEDGSDGKSHREPGLVEARQTALKTSHPFRAEVPKAPASRALRAGRLVRLGALTQHLVHSSIHMLRLQNGGALGIVTEEAHVFSKEDRVLHFPLSAGVEHDGGRAVEGLVGDLDELRAKVDSDNMCK